MRKFGELRRPNDRPLLGKEAALAVASAEWLDPARDAQPSYNS
jgi:hypothetical protein